MLTEVQSGDIVIYDGDSSVQTHLTDQRVLVEGKAYVFEKWHHVIGAGIMLREFMNCVRLGSGDSPIALVFPAKAFHKKV